MELVDLPGAAPAPAPETVPLYDWSLEEEAVAEDKSLEENNEAQQVAVHVDDPNGFLNRSDVAFGHNPTAKPTRSALRPTSAFSFSKKSPSKKATGSVLADSSSVDVPRPKKSPALGKGIQFASKKFVREITARSRSQKARTRRQQEEQEGASCSVM